MDDYFIAHKALPIGDGVMFLFEGSDPDMKGVEPKIKVDSGKVYVLLGKNAIPVTKEILEELQAAPQIALMECKREAYQPECLFGGYKFNPLFLAKVEGVLEATPST